MPQEMYEQYKSMIGLKVESKGGFDMSCCEGFDFIIENVNKALKERLSWAPSHKVWLTACDLMSRSVEITAVESLHHWLLTRPFRSLLHLVLLLFSINSCKTDKNQQKIYLLSFQQFFYLPFPLFFYPPEHWSQNFSWTQNHKDFQSLTCTRRTDTNMNETTNLCAVC